MPALRSLTERFRHTVSIELSVDSKIPQTAQWDWSTLPEEFRVGVYRIVEEALDNVVKHAGARMARVTVQYNEDETISLDISDDGRGFEVGDASASFGLMTIGEYAAALGGKLHVGSVPSQGTWVEVYPPGTAVLTVALRSYFNSTSITWLSVAPTFSVACSTASMYMATPGETRAPCSGRRAR